MDEFVSESITPLRGSFDTGAMAAGLPGLPQGFAWHGASYTVSAVLESWKHTSPEGGRVGNEVYLRRHYFRLRMSDNSVWTVYFVRQTPRGGSPRRRWFLETRSAP